MELSCRDRHGPLNIFFLNIRSLSSKNMQHKKNAKNVIFWKKNQMFIIQKFEKTGPWRCAPSHGKWNKIIKFILSVKLWEEMHFLQDPQKAYIFYAIRFLYASQKKSRNKLCLEPHDTYVLFRTFFSQVNNKRVFFWWPIPLNITYIKKITQIKFGF